MSNILQAIQRIVENPITKVEDYFKGNNRVNSVGEALENHIKNVFADSFGMPESDRLLRLSEVFSYLGNQNNQVSSLKQ